jgi:acetylornithine deacetylase
LKRSLIVVFIANEENSSVPGIGVDGLLKAGALEQIKNGPLFWVRRQGREEVGSGVQGC